MWKKCLDCIDELLDILFDNNNNIFIGENIAEDSENLNASEQVFFFVSFQFLIYLFILFFLVAGFITSRTEYLPVCIILLYSMLQYRIVYIVILD